MLARKTVAELPQTPPTWLPAYAEAEANSMKIFSLRELTAALERELTGEAALARAEKIATACNCETGPTVNLLGEARVDEHVVNKTEIYDEMLERRYNSVNRCC